MDTSRSGKIENASYINFLCGSNKRTMLLTDNTESEDEGHGQEEYMSNYDIT